MTLVLFPARRFGRGTVHVFEHEKGGYAFSHESRSGDSWGPIYGPYQLAEEAIAGAHALSRESCYYCEVSICDAALTEVTVGASLPSHPYQLGDF